MFSSNMWVTCAVLNIPILAIIINIRRCDAIAGIMKSSYVGCRPSYYNFIVVFYLNIDSFPRSAVVKFSQSLAGNTEKCKYYPTYLRTY